jgi:Flp pilus assembly protein TadD
MGIRVGQLVIVVACLAGLVGCSSSAKLSDLWAPKASQTATAPAAAANADATGSISTTATTGPDAQPAAAAEPGLLGSDPHDALALGKKYFRANNFGLAEQSFQRAVELHPNDAEAWVDLASSYDRLRRFDLADRAYAQAIRLIGPTAEILNDQGFSYMLRGDYKRAHKKLEAAARKDPANPYVQANMDLLQRAYYNGKAVE